MAHFAHFIAQKNVLGRTDAAVMAVEMQAGLNGWYGTVTGSQTGGDFCKIFAMTAANVDIVAPNGVDGSHTGLVIPAGETLIIPYRDITVNSGTVINYRSARAGAPQ